MKTPTTSKGILKRKLSSFGVKQSIYAKAKYGLNVYDNNPKLVDWTTDIINDIHINGNNDIMFEESLKKLQENKTQ